MNAIESLLVSNTGMPVFTDFLVAVRSCFVFAAINLGVLRVRLNYDAKPRHVL